MSEKRIRFSVKFMIAVVFLCGAAVCVLWYPFSISLTSVGVTADSVTKAQRTEFWTQLLFYWSVSIPCFLVLIIAWRLPMFRKTGASFSFKDAKRLRIISGILYADCVVFFIGNLVFTLLKWNDFAMIYIIVLAAGLASAAGFTVLSYYVKKAAELREENESYI